MKRLFFAVLSLLVSISVYPDKLANIKGCTFRVIESRNSVLYAPFVMVAKKANDNEDGESEIWGYNPQDIKRDREGHMVAVNIKESEFLKDHEFRMVKGHKCRCPPAMWGSDNTVDASTGR